ncbi:MAG: hypothetical protein C5B59_19660 [Bacteroidetes bacterium]|nr:MAG: hypothetical protein C5B59_19660 [Bacteroidota bacterium]
MPFDRKYLQVYCHLMIWMCQKPANLGKAVQGIDNKASMQTGSFILFGYLKEAISWIRIE